VDLGQGLEGAPELMTFLGSGDAAIIRSLWNVLDEDGTSVTGTRAGAALRDYTLHLDEGLGVAERDAQAESFEPYSNPCHGCCGPNCLCLGYSLYCDCHDTCCENGLFACLTWCWFSALGCVANGGPAL
jgi:hypothetical protein